MSNTKLPAPLVVCLGIIAFPVFLVLALVRAFEEAAARHRARAWLHEVERDGLVCPEGHAIELAPSDRYKCSTCGAVIIGTPFAPCYCCGEGVPVSFIDCPCGLSVPVHPHVDVLFK